MVVGKMLESGDLTGLKFTLSNAAKDLRYYTHFTESMMLPSTSARPCTRASSPRTRSASATSTCASLIEAQEKLGNVHRRRAVMPRRR